MWRWIEKPAVQGALVAVLAGIVVLLGVLQYQAAEQAARTDEERLRRRIADSAMLARREINGTLLRLVTATNWRGSLTKASGRAIAGRLQNWLSATDHADIVTGLYMIPPRGDAEEVTPWRLDIRARRFEDAAWTEALRDVAATTAEGFGREESVRRIAWLVDGERALLARRGLPVSPRGWPDDDDTGWLVFQLDAEYFQQELIGGAVAEFFELDGRGDLIVDIKRKSGNGSLYSSEPGFAGGGHPDFVAPLLWDLEEYLDRGRSRGGEPRRGEDDRGRERDRDPRRGRGGSRGRPPDPGPGFFGRGRGGPPALLAPWAPESAWVLSVTHREGSVERAMAAQRTRNLVFGFGVLGVLAAAMGVVVMSARRSGRLARMQLDFVAGVSHELRTPLAVIRSAGENLADGVVAGEEGVTEYGALIRDEGRRLSRMVENTLQFSASERGFPKLETRAVAVGEVFGSLAAQLENLPRADGTDFAYSVDGDVVARADTNLLQQCLLNLVENAIKYSPGTPRVRLSAAPARGEAGLVEIRVEDEGPGIAPADLPHVFDAFYRGSHARDAQIEGSGLGLKITKDAIEAMGGRIEVQSALGKGSTFVISLPSGKRAAAPTGDVAALSEA